MVCGGPGGRAADGAHHVPAPALVDRATPDNGSREATCCKHASGGVGAGIRKEDTALKEKINAAIAELAKQKKFTEITKSYPELQGILVTPESN